jgi:uncharacterized membrane protein
MNNLAKKGTAFLTIALVALLLAAGAVFALNIPGFGKCEKVKAVNGVVSIPLAKVSDGKAHFFRYSDGGKEIAFFVVKAADGSIRTAFDACDVCFKDKKGYVQEGDAVICKNCNKKFAIARIGEGGGGCNPSSLKSRTGNGHVVIGVEDIKSGARFF